MVKAVSEAVPAPAGSPGLAGQVVTGGVPGHGLVLGARLGHLVQILLVYIQTTVLRYKGDLETHSLF